MNNEPSRADIEAMPGPVLLEFGTPWCGHCRAAQPLITAALEEHPAIRRIQIEDGSGRRLGRSYGVKLWPTLIFIKEGREVARLVRPAHVNAIREAAARVSAA